MDKLGLIDRLADPELIKQMSTSDKLLGALIVTVLGMVITFVVLMLLWGLIVLMTKIMNKPVRKETNVVNTVEKATPKEENITTSDLEEEGELVTVITAAIAASMQRPIQTILVKKIKRTQNKRPAWANAAQQEQINSRRF